MEQQISMDFVNAATVASTAKAAKTPNQEDGKKESKKSPDSCQKCGKESDFGAHGIRGGEVYDEYWCEQHYHEHRRNI